MSSSELVNTRLSDWGRTMDEHLRRGEAEAVAPLAQVVLRRLPRHLPTYARLLEAFWQLRRWDEGEEWGRRLLQADPYHGNAWRAVAQAAEQRGDRAVAQPIWRRAFEVDPYQPDIRAGLTRTTLGHDEPLTMTEPCLGTLYLRGYRWRHAIAIYRTLVRADRRRLDFQVNLMAALWRQPNPGAAYQIARHLTRENPLLLLPWYVQAAVGDDDDRALAYNPLATMDPDGEYLHTWLRLVLAPAGERALELRLPAQNAMLTVSSAEARFLAFEPVV
jgi:tetratricopeptide (TPR) repeat protein